MNARKDGWMAGGWMDTYTSLNYDVDPLRRVQGGAPSRHNKLFLIQCVHRFMRYT